MNLHPSSSREHSFDFYQLSDRLIFHTGHSRETVLENWDKFELNGVFLIDVQNYLNLNINITALILISNICRTTIFKIIHRVQL